MKPWHGGGLLGHPGSISTDRCDSPTFRLAGIAMSRWRVVITDGEDETGVAQACEGPSRKLHDDSDVYDCCPGPYIECGNRNAARVIAAALTVADAEAI